MIHTTQSTIMTSTFVPMLLLTTIQKQLNYYKNYQAITEVAIKNHLQTNRQTDIMEKFVSDWCNLLWLLLTNKYLNVFDSRLRYNSVSVFLLCVIVGVADCLKIYRSSAPIRKAGVETGWVLVCKNLTLPLAEIVGWYSHHKKKVWILVFIHL